MSSSSYGVYSPTTNDIQYEAAQRRILEVLYVKSELPQINRQLEKEFKYLVPKDYRNYVPLVDILIKQRLEIKITF